MIALMAPFFDIEREGISILFPQRDVHLYTEQA